MWEQQNRDVTALVKVERQVEEFVQKRFNKIVTNRFKFSNWSDEAYTFGRAAAHSIDISNKNKLGATPAKLTK